MEASYATIAILGVTWATLKVLNWVWLRPRSMGSKLREQGLQGTSYKPVFGDSNQILQAQRDARFKPLNLSHDIVPRALSFVHQIVNKYGKNCFIWIGAVPRVIITEPEKIKEVFNRIGDFPKIKHPLVHLLVTGVANYEGEKWYKHRRIVSPAFHLDKLKIMLPKFFNGCNDMISKWEGMLSSDGSCDVDVWPGFQDLSCDVISEAAFGSSYVEGRRLFQLLRQQAEFTMKVFMIGYIPGWRFVPTSTHRRMKKIRRDMEDSLKCIINNKENALKAGEAAQSDLLSLLLERNQMEIEERGNKKVGLSLHDVIEECKLFYLAGQETISSMLVWTIVMLSRDSEWQTRAREEVLQVFGNQNPSFDRLSHLKRVTMILHEVLRLYPPVLFVSRTAERTVKLENLELPAGVQLSIPIIMVHHDRELWGEDAEEFKPERFSEGVSKATHGKLSFLPFGWGPRHCVGQNFALLQAKMALSMILQRFWFELSPAYVHAPIHIITLQPQFGANIVLHKL